MWKSLGPVLITHGRLFVRMIGTVIDASKTMDADGVLLIPDSSGSRPGQPGLATGATPTSTVNGGATVAAPGAAMIHRMSRAMMRC